MQTQWPAMHSEPPGQAPSAPQKHAPLAQMSASCPSQVAPAQLNMPPSVKVSHPPCRQEMPSGQAAHASPAEPHAESTVPDWHRPTSVQQPRHVVLHAAWWFWHASSPSMRPATAR
jgi:hypothetical protein